MYSFIHSSKQPTIPGTVLLNFLLSFKQTTNTTTFAHTTIDYFDASNPTILSYKYVNQLIYLQSKHIDDTKQFDLNSIQS